MASPRRASREKGRAAARSVHLAELESVGAARAAALTAADKHLDRIARLLPDALKAGLTLVEIARITGVSRPTLYELRGRYGESASDLRLAVLQALATRGPLPFEELLKDFGRSRKEFERTLESFGQDGLIEYVPLDDEDGGPAVELSGEGFERLEHWFEAIADEDAPA